jgi:Ca-activated chloride channel family protein
MARVGKGEPFVVTDQKEAQKAADKFAEYIKSPLLTDISVSFDGFDAYDVEPPSVPDLFAKRPLVMFGKYKEPFGSIVIKGNTVDGEYKKEIAVSASLEDTNNTALRYLWAREKIARLADYGRVGVNVQKDVTALGLKYHLMTDYTSFVAVDKVIRDTGEVVTVKQPLPLPEGVSDLAVGGRAAPSFYLSKQLKKPNLKKKSRAYRRSSEKTIPAYNAPPMSAPPPGKKIELKAQTLGGVRGAEPNELAEVAEEESYEEEMVADYDEYEAPKDRKDAREIHIISGVFPAGMTLDDVEKIISGQIKVELQKAFGKCALKSVTITLEIESGKVKEVKIKDIKGMKCDKEEIKKIFKKLKFADSLKGTLEVSLKYI